MVKKKKKIKVKSKPKKDYQSRIIDTLSTLVEEGFELACYADSALSAINKKTKPGEAKAILECLAEDCEDYRNWAAQELHTLRKQTGFHCFATQ